MKTSYPPISAKDFRKALKLYIPIHLGSSLIPLYLYWHSLEMHSQNLAFLSVFLIIVLQGLSVVYQYHHLSIRERFKDIYPEIPDATIKHLPMIAWIPILAIPFFLYLCLAPSRSEHRPFCVFYHPGTTFLAFFLGGFALAGTNINFFSDPASLYITDTNLISNNLIRNTQVSYEDMPFSGSILNLAVISQNLIKEKNREPADDRSIRIKYSLDLIEQSTKLLHKMDDSKYFFKKSNPISVLSPIYVVQAALIMLVEESSVASFRGQFIPHLSRIIEATGEGINKLETSEAETFKSRFARARADFESTGSYKIAMNK